ncbi:Flagellum-specific peptidoglycan hydrolase FlgJ [Pilibacter termitis]|uniref:Peptidoglycan hydrolase n=1 Tax=Pilibacter termitis TaxID=263852 RepID=A0A1T4K1Y9_9ENTE|nr:LysM peptidoglycan-binding domain-containing protein [Pilibacter termitis]SJZ36424.1 Flagellum-specific peptidoglycan hydrolase FlgJ [Pilibacter termitis]
MTRQTRKERRKRLERNNRNENLKRGAKLATTAVALGSVIAPSALMNIQKVNAQETGYAQSSTSTYVDQLGGYAKDVASANGLYASVMVAQALLESGWGGSTLSQAPYNNLFGIKGSYQGQSVSMRTMEYVGGQWVSINADFRAYPSFRESFEDNARLLRTSMGTYYSGAWKENTTSYRDATQYLQGRYATDPTYASKLNEIIEKYDLTRFDTGTSGGGVKTLKIDEKTATYYTVEAGDYLQKIAKENNVSVSELKVWNSLTGDVIYIGQKLIVAGTPVTIDEPEVPKDEHYTVVAGDSVSAISEKYGISADDFRAWNNIKNDFIYAGQDVVVKKGNVETQATETKEVEQKSTSQSYKVKSGDTLWGIAEAHGLTIEQLKELNGLGDGIIYVGQTLVVA